VRYLVLYLYFLRFSFSRAMEFRLDFLFRIVMDVVFYVVQISFFAVLYRHTTLLGGWTLDQIYLFIVGFLFVDAIHMTVFSNNLWMLPIFINRGDLDYYLVRPVSSLYFLSLRDFAANSFVNLGIALGLVVWALARFPEPLGGLAIATYFGFLLIGAVVHYAIRMLFIIPVFWIQSSRGLDDLAWALERFSHRPHQIYPGVMRLAMLTLMPLAFIASVPAHVLFDGLSMRLAAHAAAVTLGSLATLGLFWRVALRSYSSASS
jgi:ABC-2 type transport system permease protein